MTFAVIQMVSQDRIDDNLAHAARLLRQAAEQGAQLAVLPENFSALGRKDVRDLGHAEALGQGPVLQWLRDTARELGLWLVAGTLPLPPDGQSAAKPRACSLVLNEQGERVARYDKLHLFGAQLDDAQGSYQESSQYDAGRDLVVVDTPVGRLGLTVCYDLRFPELYTALRDAGAELITAPSAFTAVTGKAHWEVLVRARAIETQCYLLAAAQGGQHPGGRETWGHSAIADPWGEWRALGTGDGVLLGRRDVARQAEIRERMPVADHRRFDIAALRKPVTEQNLDEPPLVAGKR